MYLCILYLGLIQNYELVLSGKSISVLLLTEENKSKSILGAGWPKIWLGSYHLSTASYIADLNQRLPCFQGDSHCSFKKEQKQNLQFSLTLSILDTIQILEYSCPWRLPRICSKENSEKCKSIEFGISYYHQNFLWKGSNKDQGNARF